MLPDARNHISDSSLSKHAGCSRRTWLSQRKIHRKEAAVPEEAEVHDALRDYKRALNELYQTTYAQPGTASPPDSVAATVELMAQEAPLIIEPQLEIKRDDLTKEGGLSASPAALKRITRATADGRVAFYIPVYCEPTLDFRGGQIAGVPPEIDLKLAHACALLGQTGQHRPPMAEVMDRRGTVTVVFPDFAAYDRATNDIYQLADRVAPPEPAPCRACPSCPWQHACRKDLVDRKSLWAIPGMTSAMKAQAEDHGVTDTSDRRALLSLPTGQWLDARVPGGFGNEIMVVPTGGAEEKAFLQDLTVTKKDQPKVYLDLLFRDRFDGTFAGYALHGVLKNPAGGRAARFLWPEGAPLGRASLGRQLKSLLHPGTVIFVWSKRELQFLRDQRLDSATFPTVALKDQLLDAAVHLPFLHQTPDTVARAIEGAPGDSVDAQLVWWTKNPQAQQDEKLGQALGRRAGRLFTVSQKCCDWIRVGATSEVIHVDVLAELSPTIPSRYYEADKSTERRVSLTAEVSDIVAASALERQRGKAAPALTR